MLMLALGTLVFIGLLVALANHSVPTQSIAQILHDVEGRAGGDG